MQIRRLGLDEWVGASCAIYDVLRRRIPGFRPGTTVFDEQRCYQLACQLVPFVSNNVMTFAARSNAIMLNTLMRWLDTGMPTFAPSHGLIESMLLTDCHGLRGRDVQLPFDAFVVTLPHPNGAFYVDAPEPGRVEAVRWMLVSRVKNFDAATVEREQGYISIPTASMYREDTFDRVRMKFPGCDHDMVNMVLLTETGLLLDRAAYWPAENEPIERWLHYERKHDHGSMESTERDRNTQWALSRVLVSLCLYIAEQRRVAPATVSPRGPNKRGGPTAVQIGTEVKLPAPLREAARVMAEKGSGDPAFRVRSRFIVRRHRRMQPTGEGRRDRKEIWVGPFWKGPMDGPQIERIYKVE